MSGMHPDAAVQATDISVRTAEELLVDQVSSKPPLNIRYLSLPGCRLFPCHVMTSMVPAAGLVGVLASCT